MLFWIIIGMSFYKLGDLYNKNKWGYAVLGIVIAVVVQLVVGIIYGIIVQPTEEELDNSSWGINLIALMVSGIVVWGFYEYLKRTNQKEVDDEYDQMNYNIEEIGKDIPSMDIPNKTE
jgi:uncharacterized BrkB/YihY/UPF0761 family membrane protein